MTQVIAPKIAAEIAGNISKIAVRAGEPVKKGNLVENWIARRLQHQG